MTATFTDFWILYPRKVAKKAALAVWDKSKLDEVDAAVDFMRTVKTHVSYGR